MVSFSSERFTKDTIIHVLILAKVSNAPVFINSLNGLSFFSLAAAYSRL